MSLKKSFIVLACMFALIMATATSTCTNITHIFVQNIAEAALSAHDDNVQETAGTASSLLRKYGESLDEAADTGQEKLEDSLPCILRSDIVPAVQLHTFILLFMQGCFAEDAGKRATRFTGSVINNAYSNPLWICLRKLLL